MRNLTTETKQQIRRSAKEFINSEMDVLILSKPMDGNYRIKKTIMVGQDQIHGKLEIVVTYTPQ